jgi:hypothetical protein
MSNAATSGTTGTSLPGTLTTGVISNALGAVGAPSYTFTGDLDTGMWSSGANTIKFSTAGADVGTISSTGAWTLGVAGVANRINGGFGVDRVAAANIKVDIDKSSTTTTFDPADITLRVANNQSSAANQYTGIAFGNWQWTGAIYTIQEATAAARMMKFYHSDASGGTVGTVNGNGAWTLGPASSTATNLAVNGGMSTTHGVFGGSSYTASVYHDFKGADGFYARGDNAVNYDLNVINTRSTSIGTSGARILLSANDGNKVAVWSSITGSNIRFGAYTALDVDFVSGSSGTTKVGGFTSAGVWTLGPSGSSATNLIVNGSASLTTSNDGGHALTITNGSNGTSATAALRLFGGGAAAASAHVMYYNGVAATNWVVGCKNSDNTFNFALSGVENLSTGIFGTISAAGAWTLGPSGSSATNLVVNGALSTTHGIVFPGTDIASAGANTLDDYEEGTWTPVFTASSTPPTSVTYTTQTGLYTKVGRKVTCTGYILLSSKGSGGAGIVKITGLPFTGNSATSSQGVANLAFYSGYTTNVIAPYGFMPNGTAYLYMEHQTAASTGELDTAWSDVGNAWQIGFSVTYQV